jgi:hypothetical protein
MPAADTTPTMKQQARHARSEALTMLVRMGVPWAIFIALTIMGNVLYIALAKAVDHGKWTGLTTALVLVFGLASAGFDWHLRRHRMSLAGRAIGPATIAAGSVMTGTFLLTGYWVPLVLTYMLGGIAASVGWDAWLHHAAHHDLSIGFGEAAVKAGLGNARVLPPVRQPAPAGQSRSRARRDRDAMPRRLSGTVALDGGAVTPREAAERAANLEGALGYPPGALGLTQNARHGGWADYTVTDPQVLSESVPWPGPSRPGGSVADPFRMGWQQDMTLFEMLLLPIFHTMSSGTTGSGKTMSWFYNRLAEGVTRTDYAAFSIDLNKMWQFLGPVRAGLHGAAVTAEDALELLTAFERARIARLDYLSRRNMTEWRPGCGLTFLDFDLQECPDVFTMLERISRGKPGAPYTLDTWKSAAKGGRSWGAHWETSLQLAHNTEMPTVVRGQMQGRVCFGTANAGESKIGLTTAQAEAGCRPELWGVRYPGKAYADLPTRPAEQLPVPVRLFDWGRSGEAIAAYMEDWEAAGRPLDEVTGEAMENRPAEPPSYGLPGPGRNPPGSPPRPRLL